MSDRKILLEAYFTVSDDGYRKIYGLYTIAN